MIASNTDEPSLRPPPLDFDTHDRKRFQEERHPTLYLDAEASILHMNTAARNALEYTSEQVLTASFLSIVNDKNLYQVIRDVEEMICYNKQSASWLLRLRTGRGRWKWYHIPVENRLADTEESIVVRLVEP